MCRLRMFHNRYIKYTLMYIGYVEYNEYSLMYLITLPLEYSMHIHEYNEYSRGSVMKYMNEYSLYST